MWWNSMSTFQQTLFIIACAATFLLIMQILLMLIGGSNEADAVGGGLSDAAFDGDISADGDIAGGGLTDGDFSGGGSSVFDGGGSSVEDIDSDAPDITGSGGGALAAFGLRLISLRSIIAFLAIGGWVGYTLCYSLDWYYSLIIALVCGLAAACGMAGAMLGLEKMQSSGNINPQNAVGKIGTVYLTVPPERSGRGKINILIQERYAEYEAVTDDDSPLPTASEIKVLKHLGSNVLLVTKYKKPAITIETVK